ncbi:TolC family protein [Alistipes sp.]|uniref:TolC family protein n=1 Tax=Alistipes sp. TaxID=1872444 RepID=UPI003AB3EB96
MKRIALLCGCLLAGLAANAQVTLDECRRLAREHYPEIRQYDLVRQTEQYTLSNARRAWLPQLSLAAQATWQTDVPSFPNALAGMLAQQGIDMPGMNKDQYKVALELNQTLWDGGKSGADKRIAQAEAAEQARSADVDLYALQGRVDNLFFGILLLDERIAQTRLTIDLLRSNLDKVRALQRNGVAMQTDADAVEAELLTVNQQLTQITASRESYRRMLEVFIGRSLGGKPLARPDVTEPRTFEPARPELALFDATADKLMAQERLVKSATRPHFGLFAQGYYGYPGMDYFQSMMSSDWSWNALVGVKMSWNFGAYYTKKNSLNKLRTAKAQVEVQRDIFLFNTRLQTTEENGDIARLRKALADDDRIVALRRSVREAAESKLRNGVIDTNDLLQKITDEAAAATARSAREIELLKSIYELKHTLNR